MRQLFLLLRRMKKISLADSLSIKESLYSIASISPFNNSPSMFYRSVEPLLSVTLNEYGTLANHYGIKFEYELSADSQIKVIKLCPSTLNKVLSIVLSNAISVSGKGDRIRVMTNLSQSHYSVIVLDDSSGITPATLTKIEKKKRYLAGGESIFIIESIMDWDLYLLKDYLMDGIYLFSQIK